VNHRVSRYIRDLPFLWVGVPDEPGPSSNRGMVETNSIALLSTEGLLVDPPGKDWLGHDAPSGTISHSGLWNVDHVGERYDPAFLGRLERYVSAIGRLLAVTASLRISRCESLTRGFAGKLVSRRCR
jgi:hypothetical protein